MPDILHTNISYISSHNKLLAEKILSLKESTKNFDINTNLVGEYNLLANGIPVHSLTGAQEEAKDIVKNIKHNKFGSIHIVYGLGLGYVPDEFLQSLKGKIIVFEPDLESLFFVLSTVDFSQNFKTGRLFFASANEEISDIYRKLFRYKTQTTLSYLDYHKSHYEGFDSFIEYIKRETLLVEHNYSFQVNNTYSFFESTLKNLAQKYQLKCLADYKNLFKGMPAVIVSAGPSLNKNIDTLKKYQDNALIFCVGTALKTLYNNNVTPDFLNVIEKVNTSHHYNLPFTKDICFISEQFTEPSYLNIPFKDRLITNSLENDDSRWFLEKAEKEFVDFETKGTVAYHAIYSAYYLGCNPIILIGQDLAYPDGQCYSKGSKFDGLKCVFDESEKRYKIEPENYEEYRKAYCESENHSLEMQDLIVKAKLESLNRNLVTVKGQNNDKLPTDSVYSLFINYIEDFAHRYGEGLKLVNSSLGGALIKGFEILSLEKAFALCAPIALNKKDILLNSFEYKESYNLNKVKQNLNKDLLLLNKTNVLICSASPLIDELNNEFKNKTYLTPKAARLLEKLNGLYSEITNKYMIKNRIIKMIAVKEYNLLSYLAKEHPEICDYDVAFEYLEAYACYFRTVSLKLDRTVEFLDNAIKELEKLNESCTSKS